MSIFRRVTVQTTTMFLVTEDAGLETIKTGANAGNALIQLAGCSPEGA